MNSILSLVGREKELFSTETKAHEAELPEAVRDPHFLVLGGSDVIRIWEASAQKPLELPPFGDRECHAYLEKSTVYFVDCESLLQKFLDVVGVH